MSAPVLDAPDPEIQAIMQKLYRGQGLSKAEQTRWANRLTVEKETKRVGGSMKGSAIPQRSSAHDVGRMETQEAVDYLHGRDEVLGRAPAHPGPAMSPTGQPQTRRSEISNDYPVADKIADNMQGPHLGADGLPAMWNVPKRISGGYNGADIAGNPGNLSNGTIAYQTPDGNWKAWRNGKADQGQYASLNDVGANKPVANQQADALAVSMLPEARRGAGAPAGELPKAAPTSLEDDEKFIRSAGYGDFVDRAQQPTTAPSVAAARQSWDLMMGRGGAGGIPRAQPQAAPTLPSAEAVAAAPNPPQRPADPIGMPPVASPISSPTSEAVRTAFQPVWNTPAPAASGRASQPYQSAAERFNPFERRRRVLPE